MTLKEINPRLANEFIHLKEFCTYDGMNYLDNGIALKEKKSNKIFCFKDYDLWRDRGNYFECKYSDCKYYCIVNSNQTKLDDF